MRGGEPQTSDRRLFMQLLAFSGAHDSVELGRALESAGLEGVLYKDVNDPHGIGLLTWNEHPDFFVSLLRPFLTAPPFSDLVLKPEFTMIGRSYALGHEPDLDDWLLHKPRRTGEFSSLPSEEQGPILAEHGRIGHAFGEAGYAQDVRLACFGLDPHDNDFVIGLIGSELFPLSACVQHMRKTRQTSRYLSRLGPFFVGRVLWQAPRA